MREEVKFFIIGCQRSGTTLMRLILECHSEICCYDEQAAYAILAGWQQTLSQSVVTGMKVPCITEQVSDQTWVDFLLLPEIPNPYSGQRLIFIVRDVRDAVASMLRLVVNGRSWMDFYCIPCIKDKINRCSSFCDRYATTIEKLQSRKCDPVAWAAFYWCYKTEALFRYIERGYPVHWLRYEDLSANPRGELLKICAFLGVPWEPGLLEHPTFSHPEIVDGLAIGKTDPRRSIDTKSIGSWRRVFRPNQLRELLEYAGDAQEKLNAFRRI